MPPLPWGEIIFYAFAAVTAVQVFYYTWFFSRIAFFKPKSKTKTQHHPVSVIICARDEDENLARNLPGVLVQSYPSTYEVVAVNDNSLDDSKYILQELKKTFKSLNVVELTQEAVHISGKKYPLSIGIREAKHEVLLLTDADCVPASEHWVEKMQNGYDEHIQHYNTFPMRWLEHLIWALEETYRIKKVYSFAAKDFHLSIIFPVEMMIYSSTKLPPNITQRW